ncbi:MAG: hypothetical protein MK089_05080 [Phycisphaerales bacterium]|nr:hypothetical protein [Phycisphaerales bacterium]
MSRPIFRLLLAVIIAGALSLGAERAQAADGAITKELLASLNSDDSIRGDDSSKAWQVLFDAYLKMSPPPQPVGPLFNLDTIWPGMSDWSSVMQWAKSNPGMADAVIQASERAIIGLPYGCQNVPSTYAEKGLCIDIDVSEGQRTLSFGYLDAVDVIAAYCTAEIYRRLESGDTDGGIKLMMAQLTVMRMFCDRQFMDEKLSNILMLTRCLSNARDCFWKYMDQISVEQFQQIAMREIPYLRPDRARLLIPEADRLVADAVLQDVFDEVTGDPIPERFAVVFTRIQAEQEPLTRLGAAKRWRNIAMQHGSFEASRERLKLIYDDWWRRWRLREYGDLVTYPSEFDKTNAMRYAGVLLSIENIQQLFLIRNNLRVAVYGTAVSAALCAFKRDNGSYPASIDNRATRLYGSYLSKKMDADPYYYREELNGLDSFRYRVLRKETSLDVGVERLWLEAGEALLYSLGGNQEDDLGAEHVDGGDEQDIVLWPPVKALLRQEGSIE